MLAGAFGLALLAFLTYHLYLISQGMTTNETLKWSTVNKIHRMLVHSHERYLESLLDDNTRERLGEKWTLYKRVAYFFGFGVRRPRQEQMGSGCNREEIHKSSEIEAVDDSLSGEVASSLLGGGTHVATRGNENDVVGCVPSLAANTQTEGDEEVATADAEDSADAEGAKQEIYRDYPGDLVRTL